MDKLSSRGITLIGVRAHEPEDVRRALAMIETRRDLLEKGSRTRIGAGSSGSRAETYRSGSGRRRDPSRGAQPLERLAVTENRGMQ